MEIVKNWESEIQLCAECYRECGGFHIDSICEDCHNAIMQEIYAEIAR